MRVSIQPSVRALFPRLALSAALLVSGLSAAAADAGRGAGPGNYDVRVQGRRSLSRLAAAYPEHSLARAALAATAPLRAAARESALQRLRTQSPGAEMTPSLLAGGAEVVRSASGLAAAAAPGRPLAATALDFLRDHAALYGLDADQAGRLEVLGESSGAAGGLRLVRLQQRVRGLPVFQSETRVVADATGRLYRTVGRLVPGVAEELTPDPQAGWISAREALAAALSSVGIAADPRQMTAPGEETAPRVAVAANHAEVSQRVESWRVYFPLGPGVLVPAWAQVFFLPGGASDWYTVVDARTGILLYRKDIRSHWQAAAAAGQDARFSVYVQGDGVTPADSPAPQSPNFVKVGDGTQFPAIPRTVVSMLAAASPAASPGGWLPDGVETTAGNNVIAYLDRDGNDKPDTGALDADGMPRGNPDAQGRRRDFLGDGFNYTPAPLAGDPDQGDDPSLPASERGAVTNLFYVANWYHDRLFELGFDPAAGNFQDSDRVHAEAQQGADKGRANNANFATPPDGQSGIMRMFLFNNPTPERDGSLDSDTMVHELTHGVSNRLIGNAAGLNWFPGLGMGEGWSDFIELSLLNGTPGDNPNLRYPTGPYVTYRFQGLTDNYVYGIRRFPYSTNKAVNPLTWADVDDTTVDLSGGFPPSPLGLQFGGANEVHNTGEVWAVTLWQVRSRIIAAHGGDVPTGNRIALQIVIDALKMTPIDPSFLEARDALLDADCAANGCAHEAAIWGGFAARGLGYGAVTSRGISFHHGVHESGALPFLTAADVHVNDASPAGNGDGVADPGEKIGVTVTLRNPWRGADRGVPSATATLTCAHPGVKVTRGTAAYGAIAPEGTAAGGSFLVTVDASVPCGESLACTLRTQSALGTSAQPLELRTGKAAGLGTPAVFSRDAGDVAIPDAPFQGGVGTLTDTFGVGQDVVIGKLDLRLDDLRHTFDGDLAVVLKGPSGYAADLIYRPAGAADNQLGSNDGHNFFQTVIDDAATRDLMVEPGISAPFPGSWLPALNSPTWDPVGDPVGQLAGWNGQSLRGDWKLLVADTSPGSTGSLLAWSLLATPVRFACSSTPSDVRLLAIHSEGVTFSGQPVSVDTRIFRNGLTQLDVRFEPPGTGSGGGRLDQSMAGTGSAGDRQHLRGALAAGDVGTRTGGCGTAGGLFPAGYVRHTVTWFGPGEQSQTFTVGGNFGACDTKTRAILNAIGDYLVAVRDKPGTVFIPGPEPPPLPLN